VGKAELGPIPQLTRGFNTILPRLQRKTRRLPLAGPVLGWIHAIDDAKRRLTVVHGVECYGKRPPRRIPNGISKLATP
jgi:hypothetical protein